MYGMDGLDFSPYPDDSERAKELAEILSTYPPGMVYTVLQALIESDGHKLDKGGLATSAENVLDTETLEELPSVKSESHAQAH